MTEAPLFPTEIEALTLEVFSGCTFCTGEDDTIWARVDNDDERLMYVGQAHDPGFAVVIAYALRGLVKRLETEEGAEVSPDALKRDSACAPLGLNDVDSAASSSSGQGIPIADLQWKQATVPYPVAEDDGEMVELSRSAAGHD